MKKAQISSEMDDLFHSYHRMTFNKTYNLNIFLCAKMNDENAFKGIIECISSFMHLNCCFFLDLIHFQSFLSISRIAYDMTNNQTIKNIINIDKKVKYDSNSANSHTSLSMQLTQQIITLLSNQEGFKVKPYKLKYEDNIDLIITIGGDGTILHAINYFEQQLPPIISFEEGTLGFMCLYSSQQIDIVCQQFIKEIQEHKQVYIQKKMRINCTVFNNRGKKVFETHCLNEIILDRHQSNSLLKLDIKVNNHNFTTLLGDGLILSTPNGSTAYNLSAGGPIIQNDVRSITMSAICPHSLSFRPIVLGEGTLITLQLAVDSRCNAKLTSDGQKTFLIEEGFQIQLEVSEYDLPSILYIYSNNIQKL